MPFSINDCTLITRMAGVSTAMNLREMDSAYRYGGEEFTVMLPETRLNQAEMAATRLKAAISGERFVPERGKTAYVTASLGLTELGPGEAITEFVQRADRAMYMSKHRGRNAISCIPPQES